MSDDTRPTPPTGMPAAEVTPETLLLAIKEVRDEVKEVRDEARSAKAQNDERLGRLELTTAGQGGALKHLSDQVTTHAKHLSDLTEAQLGVVKTASSAAEMSAQAMRFVHESKDDNRKMVESAMAIHKEHIASAVTAGVKPVSEEVGLIKQDQVATNEAVGAIVNELGIGDRVVLGTNVRPGDKVPEPAFHKIERRAKHSTLVQALIALGVIVEALWRMFGPHS